MSTAINMKIIKLNEEYKDQFYSFTNTQLTNKGLSNDPYWSTIEWISDKRSLYAAVDDDDNFLMTMASNHSPVTNMPWRYGDTQISASSSSLRQNIETTKSLIKFVLADCEEQGIWGHWFISDYRKIKAHNRKSVETVITKDKVGRFAVPYIEAFENYNLHDVAIIKKGCKSNIPLYDFLVKAPVPYDVLIRFVTRKYQYFRDNVPTYG